MVPWVLRLLADPPVRMLVSPDRVFRVGRDTEADLCLDDKLVSREHCELAVTPDGALEVHDLGSRNGTRLNGKPVKGRVRPQPGDELRIGSATVIVDGPKATSRASSLVSTVEAPKPRVPPPADWATAPQPETPLKGYELESELARSRTGVVHRARARTQGLADALVKILEPDRSSAEGILARVEAEASVLARIDHPNIVRLIDTRPISSHRFYTMEWVTGRTLEEAIRDGPLAPRDAISVAVQVARALATAHASALVHRDLAPACILVTPSGVARLFDFTLVKPGEEVPMLAQVGEFVRDVRYAAPEMVDDPRDSDPRSDLYALGAVLYHAVTGRPPIEGRSDLDTCRRIRDEQPLPLADLAPDARPRLAETVKKLLEKDPDQRFQSASEVARALAEALLEAVIAARSVAPPQGAGIGADFRGIELLELVQLIELRRASGILSVTYGEHEATLRFRTGEIVGAAMPGSSSSELDVASRQILDIREGAFAFRSDPAVAGEVGPSLRPADLALDVLRSWNSAGPDERLSGKVAGEDSGFSIS